VSSAGVPVKSSRRSVQQQENSVGRAQSVNNKSVNNIYIELDRCPCTACINRFFTVARANEDYSRKRDTINETETLADPGK